MADAPLKSLAAYSQFVTELHNRIPAPEMSFSRPNLPAVIRELEEIVEGISNNA